MARVPRPPPPQAACTAVFPVAASVGTGPPAGAGEAAGPAPPSSSAGPQSAAGGVAAYVVCTAAAGSLRCLATGHGHPCY